jgi:excinuclease UvrABC nuclease subunit
MCATPRTPPLDLTDKRPTDAGRRVGVIVPKASPERGTIMSTQVPSSPGAYRLELQKKVIYVGSSDDLGRRYGEWRTNPTNPCVARWGWDRFVYQATQTVEEARRLEAAWVKAYDPPCNRIAPPM